MQLHEEKRDVSSQTTPNEVEETTTTTTSPLYYEAESNYEIHKSGKYLTANRKRDAELDLLLRKKIEARNASTTGKFLIMDSNEGSSTTGINEASSTMENIIGVNFS